MKTFDCALITGASSGIGKALAYFLAQKKIPLLLSGRNEEELFKIAVSLKQTVPVFIHVGDLTDQTSRHSLIQMMNQYTPNLVINNAGMGYYGDVLNHTTEEQMKILDLNANALLEISIEAAKMLRSFQKQGVILNISSAAAFFAFPSFTVYAASKAFVNQFSQGFDAEISKYGIRVLAACPGSIETDFQQRASKKFFTKNSRLGAMSPEKAVQYLWKQIEQEIPLYVFDLRYQIMLFFLKLLPKKWIDYFSIQSIKKRIS